mmetsp:Transcript_35068/g.87445  ORF Transcript_35068/g.87445 Transcript_35068/m.87445 type:complete len:91 (-) Transcript_35068:239-511(-)
MSPLLEYVCLGKESVCLAASVEVGRWVAFRCADNRSSGVVADNARTRALSTESTAEVLQHVPCLPRVWPPRVSTRALQRQPSLSLSPSST